MSNCASLLKRSHASKANVDQVLLKVRQKAKPAKDEMLARSLQAELESLLAVAEEEVAAVRKLQDAMTAAQRRVDVGEAEADQVLINACSDFDDPGQRALQATLRCTKLLDNNVKQIHGPTEELKQRSAKLASQARQLRSALDQLLDKVRLAKMAAVQRVEKEARRVAAEKEAKRQEAIFEQYDQDHDGVLRAEEITAYVKGEHHFDLAEEKLHQILQISPGGVSKQHFSRLRSQIAVVWSEILQKQRKERSEKQLSKLRQAVTEIQSALSGVEAEVVKAETQVRTLPPMMKRAGMMMHQLSERTDAAETAIDAARDFLAAAKEQVLALDKEIESEASFHRVTGKVALKQRLAKQIGVPRFRLRLLQDNSPLDEDQTLAMQVVQLVRMEFLPPDMEQDRGIMVACEESDGKLLEQHLNQPRNPNFEDSNGTTPLCTASLNGNLNCVSLLIEAGANKDQGRKDTGATPLWIAAYEGHLEVVRFLVESGANKDQGRTDNGATPLYIAAQNGHIEVVRFLVESGANKDQGRKDTGATPLWIAAYEEHLEVVQFLVESGANKDQGRTDNGATPLYMAAQNGHLEVVRFLAKALAQKEVRSVQMKVSLLENRLKQAENLTK
eukprot:symbB.v1.2.035994.t2/scaffold4973.1/size32221/1